MHHCYEQSYRTFWICDRKWKKDWRKTVNEQQCPFLGKRCYKVRKSDPSAAIGSCAVLYGRHSEPIIIGPTRLIDRQQIFTECLHLLTTHEPGNELHVVSEISVPGGSVDYCFVSARKGKVKDCVGIELRTLDTTGTVWPERQRQLKEFGLPRSDKAEDSERTYGINWKMTAKTILIQMHHKIQTFEHVNKKLVLVTQDKLIAYMRREFNVEHLKRPAVLGDSMYFHPYSMEKQKDSSYKLSLQSRLSTDTKGIRRCLGLQAEARIELEQMRTGFPQTRFLRPSKNSQRCLLPPSMPPNGCCMHPRI